MAQKKTSGKRSSKIHNVAGRPTVRIPADQRVLGRWGYRCIWRGSDYVAVPNRRSK